MKDDRPRLAIRLRSRAPVPKARPESEREPYRWQWWKVYDCGQRAATVHTLSGDVASGQSCGTPGCHACDKKRLGKVVAPARVWARPASTEWSLYTFTLGQRGPGGEWLGTPARSAADVREVMLRWRATLLSAARAGLWFGGSWVVEVVPLASGGLSDIPCPYRTAPPAERPCDCGEDQAEPDENCKACRGTGTTRGAHPLAVAASVECGAGRCVLCHGHGVLPLGHVHLHAVVLGRPVWYADPTDPVNCARLGDLAERDQWHRAPGGRGFHAWAERLGWGRAHRAEGATDAASAYIGKGAGAYAAKGAPNALGAFYSQAYLRSGREAREVFASNFGSLYGLRARTADPYTIGFSVGEPNPATVVDATAARGDAILRGLPRVVVVEGDPQEGAERWQAQALATARRDGSRALYGPVIETAACSCTKGTQSPASGVGASSPDRSRGGCAECGRPSPVALRPAGHSFPQSCSPGAGVSMLDHGRGAPEGAEPRPARGSLGSGLGPVSSSTGANCDGPPLGGARSAGEGAEAPCERREHPGHLLPGPFLAGATAAEWWEPWLLSHDLAGLAPWWVGGCAASCRAFERREQAERFACIAALSRILGVLAHERNGRLSAGEDRAGTCALESWAFSDVTRATFGASWHLDLAREVRKHAGETDIFSTRTQEQRLAICADILGRVHRGG